MRQLFFFVEQQKGEAQYGGEANADGLNVLPYLRVK
jgi:hypothetical protein